jgi:sorting nexin-7/30/sorting nexin-8
MSESLEQKQQYLRSEIIDQGYNPSDFSNFMGSIRGENGLDLDTWSFADLQTVVEQFKSQISQNQDQNQEQFPQDNQEQVQEQEQEQNNNNPPQETKEEDIESAVKDNTIPEKVEQKAAQSDSGFPNDPFDVYEQTIKTGNLENNEITDKNDLFVTISKPERVNPGFFSSAYYQYTVQTNPVGYKVVRKVADFTFLYETLPLFNSAVFNPVLPHFEFGLKDDSPKKMLYIQNYVNSLIESRFFRTLPIVYEFLTLKQEEWNKKKDTYSKMKPLAMSKMPTLEGEIHININKLEDNKGLKIKDEINRKTEAFDGLNTSMDEILSTIEKLSLCFKSLAKYILDLTKSHKDNEVLFGFFNRLLSLTKIWSRDCLKQRDFLKDDVKYYFKFINKENVSYLKKYEEFKSARDDYKSKYEKIKKLPNKLPKDLEMVQKLRVNYGLQLAVINAEYQKLLERQANRCITQFGKYNDKKDIILQNFNNCIKLLNINEDQNNIGNSGQQQQEQEQEEGEIQNQESGSVTEGSNQNQE